MATILYPTKDTWITERFPDANNPGSLHLHDGDEPEEDPPPLISRIIIQFDVSGLSLEDVPYAQLALRFGIHSGVNPVGKVTYAYKLTRTDWVELEATWNSYKTGSAWTSPGGDYVTSNPSGVPLTFKDIDEIGWHFMFWNVTAIVRDAIINEIPASILIKFNIEYVTPENWSLAQFSTRHTPLNFRPYLTIGPAPEGGYIWVEGTNFAYIDASYYKRLEEGTLTGNSGTSGYTWVEGNYLHYIDSSGNERRILGTLEGATGKVAGCMWIEETKVRYIDSSGNERCFEGAT